VGPCCQPVFVVHSNEEFYCAQLCGGDSASQSRSWPNGSGFLELRAKHIQSAVEQWAPYAYAAKTVAEVQASPCPVACNAKTRGFPPQPTRECGAQAPGIIIIIKLPN
jgi:hypothetical protein